MHDIFFLLEKKGKKERKRGKKAENPFSDRV
jgi:hypothetical protein